MSHHPLATQAGIDVLQSGGNAFDAAVAIAATIAVVEPYASGPGGDAIFLLLDAKTGKKTAAQPGSSASASRRALIVAESVAVAGNPSRA